MASKEIDFYQVSLKLLMKNDKGEILALKAPESDNRGFSGYYDLPGGRIDTDEFEMGFQEIIAREAKEEIGLVQYRLNPKPVSLGRHRTPAAASGSGIEKHVIYIFFEADYLGGEIKISYEHTDYQWLNFNKIDLSAYFTSGILEGVRMYLENKDSK